MATFIGESVVNVVRLSGTTTLSYTVPSGKYAIVKFNHFVNGSNENQVSIATRTTTIGVDVRVYDFDTPGAEFLLDAGDSITTTNNATYYAVVLEYNKP